VAVSLLRHIRVVDDTIAELPAYVNIYYQSNSTGVHPDHTKISPSSICSASILNQRVQEVRGDTIISELGNKFVYPVFTTIVQQSSRIWSLASLV
jgi:hypothetical protein